MRTNQLKAALAVLVILHFIVSVVHGAAHRGAHVDLAPAALAFVIVVIMVAPVAGLTLTFVSPRVGAGVVSVSMTGAWLFGIVNHFVLTSADQVGQVDAQWRLLFGLTAGALAMLEAAGAVVGAIALVRFKRR